GSTSTAFVYTLSLHDALPILGGLICVIGQIMFDVFKLTPGHTLSTLVVVGAILDGFGLYEPLIDFAGAGATIPITSFGNSLVHGDRKSTRLNSSHVKISYAVF